MNAEEFKKIRQEFKWRGAEMAKKIGKSIAETYEYEAGKKEIPKDIARYLRSISTKSQERS